MLRGYLIHTKVTRMPVQIMPVLCFECLENKLETDQERSCAMCAACQADVSIVHESFLLDDQLYAPMQPINIQAVVQ